MGQKPHTYINNNPKLRGIINHTVEELDKLELQFQGISERHSPGAEGQKYITTKAKGYTRPSWVREKGICYHNAGLDKTPNMKVLDIGTGTGFFPFMCNLNGHIAEGLDIPSVPIYNEITKLLNIKTHHFYIKKFEPLIDTGTKYDLITAHRTSFNGHQSTDLWGVDEWMYFLEDLFINKLTENGKVYIGFNNDGGPYRLGKESLGRLFNNMFMYRSHTKLPTVIIPSFNKLKENYNNL